MNATLIPTKTKVTPDELLRMPDQGKAFELVDGTLTERNKSLFASLVAGALFSRLFEYVKSPGLGWLTLRGVSYRCFPDDADRVRRADVAFHRLTRISSELARSEGHCTIVPDLVVEVVSPNDLADDVNEKRIEWLEAGAQLVWVIHPVQQTVHAYRADGRVDRFKRNDVLTAEPVLPGFQTPVADLFKLPSEVS